MYKMTFFTNIIKIRNKECVLSISKYCIISTNWKASKWQHIRVCNPDKTDSHILVDAAS